VKFEGEDIWAAIRPTHPDFERLTQVVDWVEDQKLVGRSPDDVYAELMDVVSVAYLAANRCKLDLPRGKMVFAAREVLDVAANEWMEGFLFGLLFERKGGHRDER
jgi:hypothetical protein